MHPNIIELKAVLDDTKENFMSIYAHLTDLVVKVNDEMYETGQLVDLGFLCRELRDVYDDLRKECNAKMELISRRIALETVQKSIEDSSFDGVIRGKLASGTSYVKNEPIIPKKGSEEYENLLIQLGVHDCEIRDSGVLSLHWKNLGTLISKRLEEGSNPPEGLNYNSVFKTTFRKKRNAN